MIELQDSPIDGIGVFTTDDIAKGAMLFQCFGLKIPKMASENNMLSDYCYEAEEAYTSVVAFHEEANFLNDSETKRRANCGLEMVWYSDTKVLMRFFAIRNIKANSEILLYYNDITYGVE